MSLNPQSNENAILEGYGDIDETDWFELRYWEFLFWVRELQSYIRFAADPSNDPEFVKNPLHFIEAKVRQVAAGEGVIDHLFGRFIELPRRLITP